MQEYDVIYCKSIHKSLISLEKEISEISLKIQEEFKRFIRYFQTCFFQTYPFIKNIQWDMQTTNDDGSIVYQNIPNQLTINFNLENKDTYEYIRSKLDGKTEEIVIDIQGPINFISDHSVFELNHLNKNLYDDLLLLIDALEYTGIHLVAIYNTDVRVTVTPQTISYTNI